MNRRVTNGLSVQGFVRWSQSRMACEQRSTDTSTGIVSDTILGYFKILKIRDTDTAKY